MADEQGELFPMNAPRRPPKLAVVPKVPSYSRFRSTGRVLCDDCIIDIHRRGIQVAPYPSTARWLCRTPDGRTVRICDQHRVERLRS